MGMDSLPEGLQPVCAGAAIGDSRYSACFPHDVEICTFPALLELNDTPYVIIHTISPLIN